MSPGNFSRDPDDEKNKNFEVTWYCRRVPDEHINRELPDERQNFSEPLYDRTNLEETDWDFDDGGGCFGKGPGIFQFFILINYKIYYKYYNI